MSALHARIMQYLLYVTSSIAWWLPVTAVLFLDSPTVPIIGTIAEEKARDFSKENINL